jgi:undecaprenol kinase
MSSIFKSVRTSFAHAWRGLLLAFQTERSFRIQLAIGTAILLVIVLFPLEAWERAALLLATAAVLVLELLNSSVERLVDLLKPRLHQYVADIKDLMAGAVLVGALFAAALGALILWPHLTTVLGRL